MPTFHDVSQGSAEWLALRKEKISATDIAVICDVSPYKSPFKLWQEKLGLIDPEPENDAMRRGKELEPEALKAYSEIVGRPMKPVVITHSEFPWAMASLDGMSYDSEHICEIKIMGKKNHEEAMSGIVKHLYNYQAQWQMFVAGVFYNDYFVYSEESNKIIPIVRDDALIEEMIVKAKEFLHCLRSITPPAFTELDYDDKSDDPYWEEMIATYANYDAQEKYAKEQKEKIKNFLAEYASGRNVKGSKSTFTKVVTKGRIDYQKIPALQNLDLEEFRGPSIESYRITLKKD